MEAKRPAKAGQATPSVTKKDVEDFSGHCVLILSVWVFSMRIFRDSDEAERSMMELTAPSIFEDLAQILKEYLIIAACRITDPANDGGMNENFTVEMFVNSFASDLATFKQLDELHQRMQRLRQKILPARNKLAAHADRDAIRAEKLLGQASFEDWEDFWSALQDFVRILNEKMIGKPFEIDAGGVLGDAESLLKALRQSEHFETLLYGDDQVIADACLKLAMSEGGRIGD
jgi:AbiU2